MSNMLSVDAEQALSILESLFQSKAVQVKTSLKQSSAKRVWKRVAKKQTGETLV